ncbi:TetR/AcrR family transcriptional regulator [Mycobacterium sp. SMC-4]|uniref:TetR/AcrR family transcriptional regulator n=1 Tax=Mycobacterium sp. SMC-4 TaxID=2857059 RepID=UPI003CFDA69C
MAENDSQWRGTSPEERSEDRRDRLLTSCLELVGSDGAGALAVRAVCRQAGVSHRYFYELFADVDTLLVATYERAVGELLAGVTAAIPEGGDPSTALRDSFDAATDFLQRHPLQGRLIFSEALTHARLRDRAVQVLPGFLRAVYGVAVAPGHSGPSELQTMMLAGGLAALFTEWLSGTASFTRRELVAYCTSATVALLSLDAG